MTVCTLAASTRVIHDGAGKRDRIAVAGIALHRCQYMASRLAQCIAAIVATCASTVHWWRGDVVEVFRKPVRCIRMTGIALGRCKLVIHTLGLGIRRDKSAVVTTIALTRRTSVIHHSRRKVSRALVATIAISGHRQKIGGNVADRLTQCIGVSIQAAVTRRTGQRRHFFVVHPGRRPARRIVATVTGSGQGRNVFDRLAWRPRAGSTVAACARLGRSPEDA